VKLEELTLTDAMKAVATGHVRTSRDAAAPRTESSLTQGVKDVASRRRKPPATRVGRKGIVIYVDQEFGAAVKRLAADLNTTVQALGITAFELAFDKFGEPRPGVLQLEGASGQDFLEHGG